MASLKPRAGPNPAGSPVVERPRATGVPAGLRSSLPKKAGDRNVASGDGCYDPERNVSCEDIVLRARQACRSLSWPPGLGRCLL